MKRKTLILVLSVAMASLLAVGGTLAYFSATKTETNTFTVGNVDIELNEPNWEESGQYDAPDVYPGEALAKDPTIENTGANPCMVRIKVEWPALPGDASAIQYRTDYVADTLGDFWYDGGDGYFYYMMPLAAGEITDALFDQVVMPTDLKNGDADTEYDIEVIAEAVQAQGIFPSYSSLTGGDGMDIDGDGTPDGHIDAAEFATIKAFFTTALD